MQPLGVASSHWNIRYKKVGETLKTAGWGGGELAGRNAPKRRSCTDGTKRDEKNIFE